MTVRNRSKKVGQLAGIEYAGIAGSSKECQDAVLRLIQFETPITHCAKQKTVVVFSGENR